MKSWELQNDYHAKILQKIQVKKEQSQRLFDKTKNDIKHLNYELFKIIPAADIHTVLSANYENILKLSQTQPKYAKIFLKGNETPLKIYFPKKENTIQCDIYFSKTNKFPDRKNYLQHKNARSDTSWIVINELIHKHFVDEWLYIGIYNASINGDLEMRYAFNKDPNLEIKKMSMKRNSTMGGKNSDVKIKIKKGII